MMNAGKRIRVVLKSLAVLILLLGRSAPARAATREAAVYFSDGKILTGRIALTSGRKFKLNVPEAGKLKTTDMVTGEPVRYGKVRQFTFEPVRKRRRSPITRRLRKNSGGSSIP
ncbi:MAG: hypothetical protein ACYTAO_07200 [Planctomycetota bacterium]|jgi:hypothetical protein